VAALGLAAVPCARADSLGSWSGAAPMSTARQRPAAATLTDGRVLVAGGLTPSYASISSAEIYDPDTDRWSSVAPMGVGRGDAAAAPLPGDRVLVVGGTDTEGGALATAEIYDAAANTWSPAAPMSIARSGPAAAQLPDGRVLVAGGSDGSTVESSAEIYDTANNSWSSASPMTAARFGGAAASLPNGRILVAGGADALAPVPGSNTAEIFDPQTGVWSTAPAMSTDRIFFGLAALPDGRVVATGGGGIFTNNTTEVYDPNVADWFAAAPPVALPPGQVFPFVGRGDIAAAPLSGGRLLIVGGSGDSASEIFVPPPAQHLAAVSQARFEGTPLIGVATYPDTAIWNGSAITIGLQWQRCAQTCTNVGAPVSTPQYGPVPAYVPTAADEGFRLRIVEEATDAGSRAFAISEQSEPVQWPGFHFGGQSAYLAPRRGEIVVPVFRDSVASAGTVHYQVSEAGAAPTFDPISGVVSFSPGQREATITIPTIDHGVPILAASLDVTLSDSTGLPVTSPSTFVADLIPGAAGSPRMPGNPLGLATTPRASNALAGAQFFVDYWGTPVAQQAAAWRATEPKKSAMLYQIAAEPNTERYGKWSGAYPGRRVQAFLNRATMQEPEAVPLLATYRIVSGHCGSWSDTPADAAAYHDWIKSLAEGIGNDPAVLFLEMDSIITAPQCLSRHGITVRMHELHDAIHVLSNDPHLVTYLDAGAADALKPQTAANLLKRAGIGQIQGFFLNSTHFDWTSKEIAYGEKISKLTGGKHFVINTAENGQGPERTNHPATQGAEVICNPKNRGLGPKPTTTTGYKNVDAFAWIAHPGVSGGPCTPGAPKIGAFWPAKALSLVKHADYSVR
jgi:endoglucanase